MICQNSVSLTQFDNRLSPAITESDAAREQGVSLAASLLRCFSFPLPLGRPMFYPKVKNLLPTPY